MTYAEDILRDIDGLVQQMDTLQDEILTDKDEHSRRLTQIFQAVTAINIHCLNINLLLMSKAGLFEEIPEEIKEIAEEQAEKHATNRANLNKLRGNR